MAVTVVQLALSLCLILAATNHVEGSSETCEKQYQSTLDRLLLLKATCDDAEYRDCCQAAKTAQVLGETVESGVYNISNVCETGHQPFLNHPKCVTSLQALCDMDTDNGGWLMILRRKSDVSPLVNFTRTWVEYENGFGDLNTEFWYGLKNIHCLTQRDDVELKIELKTVDGTKIVWEYQEFVVDGPETNYVLHISGGTGPNSDRMDYNNGKPFSTYDQENQNYNCANRNKSGWWFLNCSYTYLTNPHAPGVANVRLTADNGANYFPEVEMKVRPKSCM